MEILLDVAVKPSRLMRMQNSGALHGIDWAIILAYLLFALGVGLSLRQKAGENKESYFLAGRSIPWWWAGTSIAATTFAADTPLAITGIVASKGVSGNWLWLSWIGVHAAVVVYFAKTWNSTRVVTDAEFISLRYSGRAATCLRAFRASLYGVVFNCIVLAWVLRAMVKIADTFFVWEVWCPQLYSFVASFWPSDAGFGDPSDAITILVLLGLVGVYSTAGGIRGVMATDLLQFFLAMFGSIWFAYQAWQEVGGREGMISGLTEHYGSSTEILALFPSAESDWFTGLGIGYGVFFVYLAVQAFANLPADGGGYFMQRLNATKSREDARKASILFLILQYLIRIWPWMVVAIAALVLIPVGQEATSFAGGGLPVAEDRELAYPVLMKELLAPGILGLLVTSLLAAFMSTIDTHLNWGSSYVVNDLFLALFPNASDRQQVILARVAVMLFVVLAVLVSFQVDTIEQAWQWIATLGASLGVPSLLRWVWWRVSAWSELCAIVLGLLAAVVLTGFSDQPYELRLIYICLASCVGIFVGIVFFPPSAEEKIRAFVKQVPVLGFWPDRTRKVGSLQLLQIALKWSLVMAGSIVILKGMIALIFSYKLLLPLALIVGGLIALGVGASKLLDVRLDPQYAYRD